MCELVLIRGLPGCGKSKFASSLCESDGYIHIESDSYFFDDEGCFIFDEDRIEEAHHQCLEQTRAHLRLGNPVVVSNRFIRSWELTKYIELEPELTIYEVRSDRLVDKNGSLNREDLSDLHRRFSNMDSVLRRFPDVKYEVFKNYLDDEDSPRELFVEL